MKMTAISGRVSTATRRAHVVNLVTDPVDTDAVRVALATAGDVIKNAISWAEHEGAGPDSDEQEAVDTLLNLAARSADEVDRLRKTNAILQAAIQDIELRYEARGAVIENAPHDEQDGLGCGAGFDPILYPCTCWKSEI